MAYAIVEQDGRYILTQNGATLYTPAGNIVSTGYKEIADHLLHDLQTYGNNYRISSSIVAWHYSCIDSFSKMSQEQACNVIAQSFLASNDWTCTEWHGPQFAERFGPWNARKPLLESWIGNCTQMQITAICCIGNAYESINIAYELAKSMEQYPAGKQRNDAFRSIAKLLEMTGEFGPMEDFLKDFEIFELYYGIHLDDRGPIIQSQSPENAPSTTLDNLDVNDLTAYSVTKEQLRGRNFYHYTDCERDEDQQTAFTFAGLELDIDDEDNDVSEDVDELSSYLPDDCWVKRIVDDEQEDITYLLYLVVESDGHISDSGCIEETTQRMQFGGFILSVPGMDLPCSQDYEFNSDPPQKVYDELRLLFSGRYPSMDYSFIGKRLPAELIEKGGNGGSNTEYTYALRSPYRNAYNHMSIDTDSDGKIENIEISSFRSTGSAYGDMFSRPEPLDNRIDEAFDMLLFVYDKYKEDELK